MKISVTVFTIIAGFTYLAIGGIEGVEQAAGWYFAMFLAYVISTGILIVNHGIYTEQLKKQNLAIMIVSAIAYFCLPSDFKQYFRMPIISVIIFSFLMNQILKVKGKHFDPVHTENGSGKNRRPKYK